MTGGVGIQIQVGLAWLPGIFPTSRASKGAREGKHDGIKDGRSHFFTVLLSL